MIIFDSFDLPAQVYEVVIFGLSAAFLLLTAWVSRNLSRIGELERSLECSKDQTEAQETVAQEYAILLGDARQRLATERLAADNLFQFAVSEIQDLELRVARAEAFVPRNPRSVNSGRDPIFDLLFGSASAASLRPPQRPGHWTWRTVKAGDPIFDAIFGSGADQVANDIIANETADAKVDTNAAAADASDINSVIDAAVKATFETKVDTNAASDARVYPSAAKVNVEESMREAFSRLREPGRPRFADFDQFGQVNPARNPHVDPSCGH